MGDDIRIIITDANFDYMQWVYDKIRDIRNIEIYPHLPINEYSRLLSESHILLFPSRYESFGLVILDAMASGVIPVAFNVRGVVRDVLLNDKVLSDYIIDYPNIKLFIKKILELYNLWNRSNDKFKELILEACKLANEYSWNNVGILWAKVLGKLLKETH